MGTVAAMIEVNNGKPFHQLGDEKVKFPLPQTMITPTLDDTCCRVDVLGKILGREIMNCHSIDDLLEVVLIGHDVSDTQIRKK